MTLRTAVAERARIASPAGLAFELNANGSVRRIDFGAVLVNLFPGSELEGGPVNLYLRRRADRPDVVGLLGPESPARFAIGCSGLDATGVWGGLRFTLSLRLAASAPAWFWHATVENISRDALTIDFVYVQDVGLAPFATVRLNEYYVSHYIDHTPLADARHGWTVASRQNLAVQGRNPWALFGSLRRSVAFATDAIQLYGSGAGASGVPRGLFADLPAARRQHEHSMVALQDAPLRLAPGEHAATTFFGWVEETHPGASSCDDLAVIERVRALPEAQPPAPGEADAARPPGRSLFAPARVLAARDPTDDDLVEWFGTERRHAERDGARLLSFFHGTANHVVLRAKEQAVLRPHGHLLRTGATLGPDESALTSTVWMRGVFNAMLTQGHVAINRLLSTSRGYLGLFRAHGQRVFVERDGAWMLLDMPSAFEMGLAHCRWIYRDADACIEVRVDAAEGRHEFILRIAVQAGVPRRFLLAHHSALDGDDGRASGPVQVKAGQQQVFVTPRAESELGRRFPHGGFRLVALEGTRFERVAGDEALFEDGSTRDLPYLSIVTAPSMSIGVGLRGELVTTGPDIPPAQPGAAMSMPELPQLTAPASLAITQLSEILPWFAHDALIHFLAPRGLEQFSGGGWGTRDVAQGPVELLLALDRAAPVRALLLRVFAAQNADGDWPQWFMFFERERSIRAGDSHGDIVFWPVVALAQYLLATCDASLLDERVPFHEEPGAAPATVWEHVGRALHVIAQRRIAGTELAAFGHGDWNDALQPADPLLRERMCSAWTVTLHHQMLTTLASALRAIGRAKDAAVFAAQSDTVAREFQQRLVIDDVVPGYALFDEDGRTRYLLHPRDNTTGVRYSLLPMIHAILAGLFTRAQARAHLALIRAHLLGPDGARLFDRPLRYHGGPQKVFQRAETSAFFGREIGVMYMHAHLRYAEALAHVGDAQGFFAALCQAHPLGLRERVPSSDLRQANCYFSSSDAAFADRCEACEHYERVAAGTVALDGGWRVYSSGPGIALGLVVRCLLGVRRDGASLVFDPVLPRSLDGLRARLPVAGHEIEVVYKMQGAYGPTALRLNGVPLGFTRVPNPYRTGGAAVSFGEFARGCTEGDRNRLEIDVG